MRLSVINAGSRTALEVLKTLFGNHMLQVSQLTLADLYPQYSVYQELFKAVDAKQLPSNTSFEKLSSEHNISKLVRNTDVLVHLTHGYFENAPDKLEFAEKIADMIKASPNIQKAIFINLLEFIQPDDKDVLKRNLEVDRKIAQSCPQANVVWSDFSYSNDSSLITFLKDSVRVCHPRNADRPQRWTSIDKIGDTVHLLLTDKIKHQLNYIGHTDEVSFERLLRELGCKNANSFLDFSKDDVLTDCFSSAEKRHYTRLLRNKICLENLLGDYHTIWTQEKYMDVLEAVNDD